MTIELPPLPEWSTHDDLDRMVPSEIRTALVVYARAAVNVALEQAADEIERLRAAGVGYSQQTVDALSSERDRLRAALIAAIEIVQQERLARSLADSRAFRIVIKRIAALDAIIAQADAALGSER